MARRLCGLAGVVHALTLSGNLQSRVEAALAAGGPLARGDPGYMVREGQVVFARAVADAIESREALVAEAGTGVGKTYAYLVPLVLSGRRALISTATKSLQDQLFLRDLPRVMRMLELPVRVALLKGRSSYLCLHRLQQARATAQLPDRFAVRALARVEAWARHTRSGDLGEVTGLDDRSPVIPLVTSTRDNCLGSDCPQWRQCHLVQARREALAAELVVVNHHLFFADMSLRDSGVAELLPAVEVAIFDEAHQMVDAGVQFLGITLGSLAVLDLSRDLLAQGLAGARGLRDWSELSQGLEKAARDLRLAAAGPQRDLRGQRRMRWHERAGDEDFGRALRQLRDAASRVDQGLEDIVAIGPDFVRLQQRCRDLAALADRFLQEAAPDHVRWVDLGASQVRLVESPLDIAGLMAEQIAATPRTWLFTSATLGDDAELSWFTSQAGLSGARKLRVASPFDYPRQARLWVPRPFVRPNDAGHPAAVGALAARCAAVLGGRTFVLTTTLRAMQAIADAMHEAWQAAGVECELLIQGSQPRRALLERFGDGQGRVLVGSHSFWEGIDMPGDALQCVVIDKLPFPPPYEPLVEAKVRRVEKAGGRPFEEVHLAETAVALKQGAGRLIRSETDHGLLVVCDSRLAQMHYGQRLRAALPPMAPLADEAAALSWLAELAAR